MAARFHPGNACCILPNGYVSFPAQSNAFAKKFYAQYSKTIFEMKKSSKAKQTH